ncbi:MAG: hypothetical protein KC933_40070, partial [Myxococcales bacterium]|nr:hypothetical protein [Myxococcales bacterium]
RNRRRSGRGTLRFDRRNARQVAQANAATDADATVQGLSQSSQRIGEVVLLRYALSDRFEESA